MKKQYLKPNLLVHTMTLCEIVCTSITRISGIDDLNISNEESDEAGITTGNSRHTRIWDDEEDYEF